MYIEDLKFSIWCDFIERSFIDGEFVDLIQRGIINGATSNPAIFKSAFLTSKSYKSDIDVLKGKLSAKEIYENLAVEDIKMAAKKMLPLYEKGDDGFVSIEVDPFLCDDSEGTIQEGRRLYRKIDMPNVMIKVPATKAGYIAMKSLVSEGINVNATLIFSSQQAKECLEAFKEGNRTAKESNIPLPKAVISIFVSRFDRKLDNKLKELSLPLAKVGIYNALKIYDLIQNYGLDNVRALFASTGVKGDNLDAYYYVKELLCFNSVNTAPLDTIKAFMDFESSSEKVIANIEEIDKFFSKLLENGIDIKEVSDELMQEGLIAFKDAFGEILKTLE